MRAWQALAAYLAQTQLVTVREALERVLPRDPERPVPFVGPASDVFWCGNWRHSSIIPTWTFRVPEGPDPLRFVIAPFAAR